MRPSDNHTIRQQIRQARRQLSVQSQQQAAQALHHQAKQSGLFCHAKHIALYLASDGEIDPSLLIDWLWQQGKQVYLPVLHPFSQGRLLFLHYHCHTVMTTNKYGIREPRLDKNSVIPVRQLDIICTPLVAFDQYGSRLGMGGGYYDRTLAPYAQSASPHRVGLAHDCQYVESLTQQHWDIPLSNILTPSQHWHWPPLR
ncbi:5-formyltetrahydrofolate cyclo-ligase [Thaumasiovibrio sp. DFM-14]|uniref:5-formyltetrahydrofolate cyclo-ligase n=1 Tax=Thaumasiovibrio sp. DFM-14 TaxID=3384792 RepID=UPI00399EF241